MTITELYDQLNKHDWHYAMSDDGNVFRRGHAEEIRLQAAARTIEGGMQLFEEFVAHVSSGKPWGTEPKPKPTRPTPAQ